ncbi:hypothetical protein M426DRAFT_320502 [Hypoxylon sp. CI-4A]|nr:hypothetical protein M426DRAFT_320502 [Hypoxylon sp. CI-4A]
MCRVSFSSKQFSLFALLWGSLLPKSRCDHIWIGDTSELGEIGPPDDTVSVITITRTIAYKPTPAPEDETLSSEEASSPSKTSESIDTPAFVTSPITSSSIPTNAASALVKATDTSQSLEVKSQLSDTSDTLTETTKGTATSSSLPPLSSPPSESPNPSVSSAAIAAITASLAGFVILAALLILWFKSHKRKRLEDQQDVFVLQSPHKQDKRQSRPFPSAIDTTGHQGGFLREGSGAGGHGRGQSQEGDDVSMGAAKDGMHLVPTTPALESGSRIQQSGLHSRAKSSTSPSDRDGLYHALLEEVRAGPALPATSPSGPSPSALAMAASSSVQWREPPATPITPATPLFDFGFNRRTSNSGVSSPAPAARPDGTLGDRAWNRRRLSTTFQPPATGPPSIPLPPTPVRPQRSFEAIKETSEPSPSPELASSSMPERPTSSGKKAGNTRSTARYLTIPIQSTNMYALGHPSNRSTQSLASVPVPLAKDVPALPRSRKGSRGSEKGKGAKPREREEAPRPTIPPIPQGEQAGSRSRRGTMYAGKPDKGNEGEKEKGKEATEVSPVSTRTVDTSILFLPEDDEHRT